MWDWWLGFFSALRHVAAASDWIDPVVQFLVTLLAGAISFFIARKAIVYQEKIADRKALAAERSAAGDAVTVAFYKLVDYGEILASMRNLLDEQFSTAAADGYAAEPYQIVRPSEGVDYAPKRVELSEVSFLAKARDIDLISDISLVCRRTLNCIHLSGTYSRERIALHDWIHGLPGHEGELQGDIANDRIPVEFQAQFERKAANLNLIIASWVEQVEDTIVLIESVFERLGKASKAEFGSDFLVLQAEFPRILSTLEDIRRACEGGNIRFSL